MRVCSDGIRLVDRSVCFLRGPKVCSARVGAWLAKEKSTVGLFMTPKLWLWLAVSRVVCGREGIYQHTVHRLRFSGTVMSALGSRLCIASLAGCLLLVGV